MLLKKLKVARTSVGLSRKALAERIGVDEQTIKRLEAGIGSVTTMVAVMNALDYRMIGVGPGATYRQLTITVLDRHGVTEYDKGTLQQVTNAVNATLRTRMACLSALTTNGPRSEALP